MSATQIAHLTELSRQTINKYLYAIRLKILQESDLQSVPIVGQIEVDEFYFGAKRVKGIRGRGAKGKIIVFGLLKRGDKVYTEIVPDCSAATTLQSIIRGKNSIDSVIHSDGWRGYDGLVDYCYKKHFRAHHGENEFARGNSHINGIESFLGYAKTRLSKFRGVNKSMFELHLKECEFRFNNRSKNMYNILLKELRKRPLN